MYIALLGRQPALSLAELERIFGDVAHFSDTTATFATDTNPSIERLGGTQKLGRVIAKLPTTAWSEASRAIVSHYAQEWHARDGKITLGISAYDFRISPRDVQKTGIVLKGKLKQHGVSLRLIPNQEIALSTATSHHNKLGLADNKVELLVVRGKGKTIIAESTGAQNITALAARDQGRPKRDAFVGMLPPKLAQIMINLATGNTDNSRTPVRVLDPFCGTGVVLQEALLMGHTAYGTDLSEKMVDYSRQNITWLTQKYRLTQDWRVEQGDAMDTTWNSPITAIASEAYLGQPFSAPPSPKKLEEVRGNCQHIISEFLKNLHPQLESGTTLCLAVPAWRDKEGSFTHLPLTRSLGTLGYEMASFKTINPHDLLYYRPDQVVARELLVMTRR